MIIGIKRLSINNETIQIKTGTCEYKPSGRTLTPILDDGSGELMAASQEKTSGMIKVEVSILKKADTAKLRNLTEAEIILELLDGTTVVGSNMMQISDESIKVSDGVVPYEFAGNVKVR